MAYISDLMARGTSGVFRYILAFDRCARRGDGAAEIRYW